MENKEKNAPKFAFFYILSAVTLGFITVSSGLILFQVINKYVIDALSSYASRFNPEPVKFGISALIISIPIFFILSRKIYISLRKGALDENSPVRKWLTYFILIVASIVMISWLVATINGFLNGELTTKFILKTITVLIISGGVFGFYLYDIERKGVVGKKDKTLVIYGIVSFILTIAILVLGMCVIESPKQTRERKIDAQIIMNFNNIGNAARYYYQNNAKLPENLEILKEKESFINENDLIDPETKKEFGYRVINDTEFELCAEFRTFSDATEVDKYRPISPIVNNLHSKGYDCIKNSVNRSDMLKI